MKQKQPTNLLWTICLIFSLGVTVLLITSQKVEAYSAAQVEQNFRQGMKTPIDADAQCRRDLNPNASTNQYNPNWFARDQVNNLCAYSEEAWLSKSGAPRTLEVTPEKGTQTIKLQWNETMFHKAGIVSPNKGYTPAYGSPLSLNRNWVSQLKNDSGRYVTNRANSNDRRVNIGNTSTVQQADLTKRFKKVVSVSSSPAGGSFTNIHNATFSISSNGGTSRYAVSSPRQFTYTKPGGFKNNETITITLCYKTISSFYGGSPIKAGNVEISRGKGENDALMNSLVNRGDTSCSSANILVKVPENWSINGQSYLTKSSNTNRPADINNQAKITAKVGDYLLFKHDMRALNGNMIRKVNWKINTTGSYQWGNRVAQTGTARGNNNELFMRASYTTMPNIGGANGNYTIYKNENSGGGFGVSPKDTGHTICQQLEWSPKAAQINGTGQSNKVCAYITYNYTLEPCLESGEVPCGGVDKPVTPGEEITTPPTPTVTNPGGKPTKDTKWILSKWEVPGTKENVKTPTTSQQNQDGTPCNTYNTSYGLLQSESTCGTLTSNHQTFDDPKTILQNTLSTFTIPEETDLGKRYCFALSISPYKMTDTQSEAQQNADNAWSHSAPYCFLISKTPKIQVWGGDSYAEKGIQTARSQKYKGNYFGSWVEYTALSNQQITGFSSASGSSSLGLNRALTFSNQPTALGHYGKIPPNPLTEKILSQFDPPSSVKNGCQPSHHSNTIVCKADTPTISVSSLISSSLQTGKTVIVSAREKDLYITQDIETQLTSRQMADIQQVILIGKTISIAPEVKKLNAWLLAEEAIVTCAEPKGGRLLKNATFVTAKNCDTPLEITGPVKAKTLHSWRTAGGMKADSGMPAERYNLRADVYLWARANSIVDGRLLTTYSKEVSPRF